MTLDSFDRRSPHVARDRRRRLHCAAPRVERTDRLRRGSRARTRHTRTARRDVRGVAEPGAAAPGRRRPAQRRLECEPRLDARRARASAPTSGRTRRLAVLGEMAELGDYSDEAHREVARAIEEIGVDVLISVGERARVYGGTLVADADAATEALVRELRPADCVLLKGARALGLERIADSLRASPHDAGVGRRHRRRRLLDRRRPALHRVPPPQGAGPADPCGRAGRARHQAGHADGRRYPHPARGPLAFFSLSKYSSPD